MDIELQKRQLFQLSRNPGKFRKKMQKLATLYSKGDLRNIYAQGRESLGSMRHVLLTRRNFKMAAAFQQIADQDACIFAAVGAAQEQVDSNCYI